MAEPYLGEIMLVGFGYAPRGWAFCQGQTLAIAQNSALFSLLGTTYGGNGVNTFALPDLRARVAMHRGTNTQPPVALGENGGTPSFTLSASQLPDHTHAVFVNDDPAGTDNAVGGFLSQLNNGYANPGPPAQNTTMIPATVSTVGASAPHENRMPFLGMNYIIALQGTFPSRN